MSQIFRVHPVSPQQRLIKQAAEIIRKGGVAIYPTDAAYAIGCAMGNKSALDRIVAIRRLDSKHDFTLLCRDLSELATYARVDNVAYRLLKHNTPGCYTFLLRATAEVPRRLMHPKKKTIGLRVPECPIVLALLEELDEPMMTATLQMPDDEYPMTDPEEIFLSMGKQVDLVIDGGWGEMECTTVVNMTDDYPEVIREGKGDPSPFMS
ncbi:threonylcarbamoyl-AMP synthase [Gammaproteobacteria bacterium 45_16_T64]|nr:threonylcarbamoyl-AMP synthase [Gammaproteobacteria bacterium 45_16_T64]